MLLFFSIDLFEGHVGMPIYSRQFIKYYKNPAIILNISSKSLVSNNLMYFLYSLIKAGLS